MRSSLFHPTKEELVSLYQKQQLSSNKIAEMYCVSPSYVSIWIRRYGIPSRWPNIADLKPSGDLWYIVGVMVGDGTFDNSRYGVKLACRDEAFATSFRDSLGRLGLRTHKWVQTHKEKPLYIAVARSKNLFLWMKQVLGNLTVPKGYTKDFLRGFYESEGSLYKFKTSHGFQLFFTNTDEALVHLVKSLIEFNGYEASLFKRKQRGWGIRPVYTLYVLGSSGEKAKFLEWINPCIKNER
jgi:intein-encoded DNA endonuclease-like protein